MKRVYKSIIFLVGLFLIYSCKKEDTIDIKSSEAEIIAFAIVEHTAAIDIQDNERSIYIEFAPDVTAAEDLTFEFILSEGATAEINSMQLVSGVSIQDFEAPFNIDVRAEDGITIKSWTIIPSNGIIDPEWGLGRFQKQSVSNNRDYEWYYDQVSTGTYANVNCGPTSTTMAAKWSNQTFSLTPEDARDAYRPEGGWWYTGDIDNYLSDNNINHYFIALSSKIDWTANILKENIDDGYIAILCLDMYYVRKSGSYVEHVDKFYTTSAPDWGHFIVIKGYKNVDNQYFFEVYDPYSYDRQYPDGALKGKDRYYRASDLFDATSIWWNNAIIVTPSETKSIPANALDPATIKHAWGRGVLNY